MVNELNQKKEEKERSLQTPCQRDLFMQKVLAQCLQNRNFPVCKRHRYKPKATIKLKWFGKTEKKKQKNMGEQIGKTSVNVRVSAGPRLRAPGKLVILRITGHSMVFVFGAVALVAHGLGTLAKA